MKIRTLQPGESLRPGEYCRYGKFYVQQDADRWIVIDDQYHQYAQGGRGLYVEPEPEKPEVVQRQLLAGADDYILDAYDGMKKPAWRVWAERKQRIAEAEEERRTYGQDICERQRR